MLTKVTTFLVFHSRNVNYVPLVIPAKIFVDLDFKSEFRTNRFKYYFTDDMKTSRIPHNQIYHGNKDQRLETHEKDRVFRKGDEILEQREETEEYGRIGKYSEILGSAIRFHFCFSFSR